MVDTRERRWLVFFALAVIVLTTIPYLIGYSRQGADWRFTGFVFGAEDGNTYIAKMRYGMSGDWLFRTPYTPFPQNGAFAVMSYIWLGKLSAEPGAHEQMVALFHLFRSVGIFLFVFASYDFLAVFINEVRLRRFGTTLITFGGGLGWLSLLGLGGLWGGQLPVEFYSPETFGFLMVYGLPHLACARAFLLWGLRDYLLRESSTQGWQSTLKGLLIWLGTGIMQPISIVTAWAVIGMHVSITGLLQVWQRKSGGPADFRMWQAYFRQALLTGVLSAPLVVYTFLAFRLDPFLQRWQAQNVLNSPPMLHYLLAFALILPLSLPGIRAVLKERSWQGWLAIGWVLVFPMLAYAPLTIQRRMPEGIWVALVVLAVLWIERSRAELGRWSMRWLSFAYLSSGLLILGGNLSVMQPMLPLFRPVEEVRAFQFIAEQGNRNLVILASHETSNALPAWATVRTVIGHGPESLNELVYKEQTAKFLTPGTSDAERSAFLREMGVTHVFWGPPEQAMGTWNPNEAKYLKPVYQQGLYSIFQVLPEELP